MVLVILAETQTWNSLLGEAIMYQDKQGGSDKFLSAAASLQETLACVFWLPASVLTQSTHSH